MAEDRRRGSRDEDVEDSENGPGLVHMPVVLMENLVDKLRLLNYDKEFLKEFWRKPINRHYFALPAKSGEQFFTFATLSAWLIRKTGSQFDNPQEEDDPNTVIANILDSLRHMGRTIDFPPNKLKQGHGEQIIFVLDSLADECLKRNDFNWKKPSYPTEEPDEETMLDDDSEVNLAKIEEEMFNDREDDIEEEEHIISVDELKNRSRSKSISEVERAPMEVEPTSIFFDPTEWKLEVERVTPQLKVTIRSDSKDWRSHLDLMHQYRATITESLSVTQSHLDKIQDDISKSLDKINSRERYLNSQLDPGLKELRAAQERLSQIKQEYSHVSGGVVERQITLTQITDELEAVKQEMEERGSNMSDGTPVVNIKKVLSKLKSEIAAMEVRRGVVEHILMQSKIRDRQSHVHATGMHNANSTLFN